MSLFEFKRWAGWFLLVLVFAAGTVWLSSWQFDRREERVDRIELIIQNYDQSPVTLDELAPTGTLNPLDEWRPVTVSGQYLSEHTTLVRNRPLNGRPGFLQLVPFQLDNGQVLIVERGWLPTGSLQDSPDFVPIPSGEPKKLVVRMRFDEAVTSRSAPTGQIANLDITLMAPLLDQSPIDNFYGRLASENPRSAEYPTAMPKPQLDEGNHLSYALQWILFGVMAFVAFGWALKQELTARRRAGDPDYVPVIKKRSKVQQDADIEDAIMDDLEKARRS